MSAGYIPQEILDEIAAKCDIVSVVNEYVPLKRKGVNYQGLCPFHNEKTPSFSVSPSKQIYHCFGCGVGGNVFKFVMEIDHLTFPEAVAKLAKRAGVALPEKELTPAQRKTQEKRRRLFKINELTARYYQKVLLETKGGKVYLDYLLKRGMSREIMEKFGLGACQNGWDGLYKFLLSRGVGPEEMLELGLVLPRKEGNGYYDRFRERIMFPIRDDRGQVVAFGGRITHADVSPQKYMNSPDTPLFHKGQLLYGLDLAKANIRQKDSAIVVEGYMDVIACHQYGITNAIAALGTAFTTDQAKLLMRNTYQVHVAFDADTAGSKATWRSLDILSELGCQVRVINLPQGSDPDEFLKANGQEAFEQLISKSQELIVYKIGRLMENINTDEVGGKLQVVRSILPDILKMNSPIARESAVALVSQKLKITENAIWSELKQFNKQDQTANGESNAKRGERMASQMSSEPAISHKPADRAAFWREGNMIKILYEQPKLLTLVQKAGGAALFETEALGLYNKMAEIYEKQHEIKSSDFSEAEAELLAGVLMRDDAISDSEQALVDYIKQKRLDKWELEYKLRVQQLADAEKTGATDEMLKALQDLESLRSLKKEIENMGKGE